MVLGECFPLLKNGKNMSIMLLLLSLGFFFPLWFDGLDHLSVCAHRSASTFPQLDFPAALTGGARERWMRNILGSGPFPWVSNTSVESDTDRVVWSPSCFIVIFQQCISGWTIDWYNHPCSFWKSAFVKEQRELLEGQKELKVLRGRLM